MKRTILAVVVLAAFTPALAQAPRGPAPRDPTPSPAEVRAAHERAEDVAAASRAEAIAHRDLDQQTRMAVAAERLTNLTKWQLWATFASIVGLAGTIGVSLWSVRQSRQVITHAKETSERELRAYVAVRFSKALVFEAGKRPKINFRLTNHGKTMAGAMSIRMGHAWRPRAAPSEMPAPPLPDPIKMKSLAPGENIGAHLTPAAILSKADFDAIERGERELVAFLELRYTDVFGTRREVLFSTAMTGKELKDQRHNMAHMANG
jgi:hypothetical protein